MEGWDLNEPKKNIIHSAAMDNSLIDLCVPRPLYFLLAARLRIYFLCWYKSTCLSSVTSLAGSAVVLLRVVDSRCPLPGHSVFNKMSMRARRSEGGGYGETPATARRSFSLRTREPDIQRLAGSKLQAVTNVAPIVVDERLQAAGVGEEERTSTGADSDGEELQTGRPEPSQWSPRCGEAEAGGGGNLGGGRQAALSMRAAPPQPRGRLDLGELDERLVLVSAI